MRQLTSSTIAIVLLVAALVIGVLWGTTLTQQGVDQSVSRNFTAAGTLAQIQLAGEQMRRYEKEAFIYAAVDDKRTGYVKEFDAAHIKLLEYLDTALAASNRGFTEEDRVQLLRWKRAAIFYVGEFNNVVRLAAERARSATSAEQRAAITLDSNNGIKAGKDQFRELLTGADKLRVAKEQGSQQIAGEMQTIFSRLRMGTLLAGLAAIALALWVLRGQVRGAGAEAPAGPRLRMSARG